LVGLCRPRSGTGAKRQRENCRNCFQIGHGRSLQKEMALRFRVPIYQIWTSLM
jgi:hypothetical protein